MPGSAAAQREMEGQNELLSLFKAATSDGATSVPLLTVSPRLSDDAFVSSFCAQRAGKDSDGNVQVTKAVLEQLTSLFGSTVESVLLGLCALCSEPWFVSSEAAFEELYRAQVAQQDRGYTAGSDLFGACFGPHAQCVVLRGGTEGLTKQVVERHELDSVVKLLLEQGCVWDTAVHWTPPSRLTSLEASGTQPDMVTAILATGCCFHVCSTGRGRLLRCVRH
jgi:hypothetical protein